MFYKYLWSNNRALLFSSLFVNYLLPMTLEMLPYVGIPDVEFHISRWMFSRRKVGNALRDDRNKIHHNMYVSSELFLGFDELVRVNGNPFSPTLVLKFLMMTILHSALETFDRQLRNRMVRVPRHESRALLLMRL